jgi:hypothetical protein
MNNFRTVFAFPIMKAFVTSEEEHEFVVAGKLRLSLQNTEKAETMRRTQRYTDSRRQVLANGAVIQCQAG